MTRADTSPMTVTMHGVPRPLLTAFQRAFPGHSPDVIVRSPGRVNLLGGHIDIHDGSVINIAIDRGIWLAAAFGTADLVQLHAADLDQISAFSLNRLEDKVDVVGDNLPRWAQYPAGVAWALQRRNLKVNGIQAAFLGNLAMRAGLSSSAAVEEAFAIAWQALENWRLTPGELAQVGREAEREYMGIKTGIQDQFTCLHGRDGHVLWLDCRSLDFSYQALPPHATIVICDTNTRRELVGSSYNGRAKDAHDTAHTISLLDRSVTKLRDVSPQRLEEFRPLLTEGQYRRSRHVVTEIARVEQGLQALAAGDVATFGRLMNESYWSARDDYGSSSDALDRMWDAATAHPGCYGARYSGGGEAGAVVALVENVVLDDFIAKTQARYTASTGLEGNLFAVQPAEGAGVFL